MNCVNSTPNQTIPHSQKHVCARRSMMKSSLSIVLRCPLPQSNRNQVAAVTRSNRKKLPLVCANLRQLQIARAMSISLTSADKLRKNGWRSTSTCQITLQRLSKPLTINRSSCKKVLRVPLWAGTIVKRHICAPLHSIQLVTNPLDKLYKC